MSISDTLSASFFTGGSLSSDVPSLYMHALDSHNFLLDTDQEGDFAHHHRTIPLLKQQTQTAGNLGERSINPNGLWRSSVESWHKGAGQSKYDLDDSDPARFRTSKGIDPWTRWQISLLPDTALFTASANTNLQLAPTSSRLFWIDGAAVKYDDDLTGSASSMSGAPGGTLKSIATNGYDVWMSDGSDIFHWVRSATAIGTSWNSTNVDLLRWVRGKARLMAADNTSATRKIYNVVAAATVTDVTPSTISADWVTVGFAEGPSVIYGAGYQGDKSLIFRWGIKSDGTGLDAGVPALTDGLPDGEIVRWIDSYLGFVLIGTDNGVRFAIPNADTGNLTVGLLVEMDNPVRCFEGQGSSVWFGWSDYDATSTGLGRLSLTTFTDTDALVPAYASDLMATGQGDVLSVCTYLGRRVFAVSGLGIHVESADLVASGTIESGWRSFGIPEDKVALRLDVRHDPIVGTVTDAIAADGATTYTNVYASSATSGTGAQVDVGEITAERFESRLTLTRDAVTTTGPVVTREVLLINPTADTGFRIIAPVLLNRTEQTLFGNGTRSRDPAFELRFIEDLRFTRRVVAWQSGSLSYPVMLEDYVFLPDEPVDTPSGDKAYTGTCVLDLKVA